MWQTGERVLANKSIYLSHTREERGEGRRERGRERRGGEILWACKVRVIQTHSTHTWLGHRKWPGADPDRKKDTAHSNGTECWLDLLSSSVIVPRRIGQEIKTPEIRVGGSWSKCSRGWQSPSLPDCVPGGGWLLVRMSSKVWGPSQLLLDKTICFVCFQYMLLLNSWGCLIRSVRLFVADCSSSSSSSYISSLSCCCCCCCCCNC